MTRRLAVVILIVLFGSLRADEVEYALGQPAKHKIQNVVFGSLPDYTAQLCGNCSAAAADCQCESKGGTGAGGPGTFDQLAEPADFGDPMGGYSAAPQMIGDFFGGSIRFLDAQGVNTKGSTLAIGAGDRQFKIVENTTPFPTDRFFFNYHLFKNPLTTGDGRRLDLSRFTFGCEKTMMDGMMSFEIRIPFASGVASVQNLAPQADGDNEATQFGNLAFATKILLISRPGFALSAGLGTTTPTAEDSTVFNGTVRQFQVFNESFHIQPFLGAFVQPSDHSWLIMFAQGNFDANGNRIRMDSGPEGVIQDQALLFLSASYGFWLHRDDSRRYIRGVAPIVELHYSTTMQDSDIITGAEGEISNPFNRMDILNMTGALRIQVGSNSFVTVSGVAPLRNGVERLFDSEFSVQYVRLR